VKTRWMILIAVVLGVIFSWIVYAEELPFAPTVAELQSAQKEFNRLYFYGGLPALDIKIGDLSKQGDIAQTTRRPDGSFLIVLDQRLNPTLKQAEMTLIHEDCHVEDRQNDRDEGVNSHELAWDACMFRVVDKGAFRGIW
jgi:hypothetical protein